MRFTHCGVHSDIDTLPGCSTVAVVSNVWLAVGERGYGYGHKAMRARFQVMYDEGYDLATCTVDESNTVERLILKDHGWQEATRFRSRKTGHTVLLMFKHLNATLENSDDQSR